jgi:hypothetical protein
MTSAEGVRFLLGTVSLKKDASYKIHSKGTDNEGFPSGRQVGHGARNCEQTAWNNYEGRTLTTAS